MMKKSIAETLYRSSGSPEPAVVSQIVNEGFSQAEYDARYSKNKAKQKEYLKAKEELGGALKVMGIGESNAREILVSISGSLRKDAPEPSEQRAAAVKDALRKKWGDDYDAKFSAARNTSRELGRRSTWYRNHMSISDLGNSASLIEALAEHGGQRKKEGSRKRGA